MKTLRSLSPPFFIFLIVSLLAIPTLNLVLAYNTYTINYDANFKYSQPYFNHLQLTNGYIINTMGKYALTNNFLAWVIDANGDLVSSNYVTLKRYWLGSTSLYNNGTTVIIIALMADADTVNDYVYTISYNTITNAMTVLDTDNLAGASGTKNLQTSQCYYYNGKIYTVFTRALAGGGQVKTGLVETTLAGVSTIHTLSTNQLFDGAIFGFQAQIPYDARYVYVFSGKTGDNTRPIFYEVNLLAHTATYYAEFASANQLRSDIPDMYISLRYLGGGIAQDPDTSNYYLYHTWVYTDEYCQITVYQDRLIFNSSGISAPNYLSQDYMSAFRMLYGSLQVSDTISIYGGYIHDATNYDIYLFHLNRFTTTPYAYYVEKDTYRVSGGSNWFDTASNNLEYISSAVSTDCVVSSSGYPYLDRSVRNMLGTYQYCEPYPYTTWIFIYTKLLPLERIFSITSTHIPSGNLYTNTQYQFTDTLFMNGIAYQGGSVVIRIDNASLVTKETDANGRFKYLVLTTVAGYHIFTYEIYADSNYEDTITDAHVFYTLEGVTPAQTTTQIFLYGILSMLPIFFILVLPAMLFFAILKSGIGLIIGLVIGGLLGVTTGLLPIGGFLLIALVVALFVVISVKRGD